jgi:hypothetical protein
MTQRSQGHDAEQDQTMAANANETHYGTSSDYQMQQPLTLDQLDYLVDLVAELREMSGRAGLTTLSGILALAQTEANAQIAQVRARQFRD